MSRAWANYPSCVIRYYVVIGSFTKKLTQKLGWCGVGYESGDTSGTPSHLKGELTQKWTLAETGTAYGAENWSTGKTFHFVKVGRVHLLLGPPIGVFIL